MRERLRQAGRRPANVATAGLLALFVVYGYSVLPGVR
ncbi:MAG: hypothetical protein QOC98_2056, partial [Frankiaceae bacterium]|nr:hypothetical protein [Frankiaceae bacterium]